MLTACSSPQTRPAPVRADVVSRPDVPIYVVRRGWHIDISLAVQDLTAPLASLSEPFPGGQYLLFGFGDRQYLISGGLSGMSLVRALWPGPGLLVVTGLRAPPQSAFGDRNVIRVDVPAEDARRLQSFIWHSLAAQEGRIDVLRVGRSGSMYYASTERYSAFHTCNTWAARGLQSARLPISSRGVEMAGQLWYQVRQLSRVPYAAPLQR